MPSAREMARLEGHSASRWGLVVSRWGLAVILVGSAISGCGASRSFDKNPKKETRKPFAIAALPKPNDEDAVARFKGAKEFFQQQVKGWPDHEWPAPPDTASGSRDFGEPMRIRGGGPKGVPKGKLDTGPSKAGGGAGANKKSANKAAQAAADEAEANKGMDHGKSLEELLADEPEESGDRNEFWEWSQTLKEDYMSGRKQVAEALLAKKKQPGADLPKRGNAPQGFLIQWRNANRSLNPYSTVDQRTVAPLKTKKSK